MRAGAIAALLFAACGPPARLNGDGGGQDASVPDAPVNTADNTENPPQCGNGVVDAYEYCDDGPLNGTSSSHCTKQCALPETLSLTLSCQALPAPLVTFANGVDFIAAIAVNRPGIQIFPSDEAGPSPGTIAFESYGTGTATSITMGQFAHFTTNNRLPIWLEHDADGAQHLYWLNFTTGSPVEIPYPFPQGSGGVLAGDYRAFMPALLDIDPATHELLFAIISPLSESDVRLHAYHFPAPGDSLGAVAAAINSPDLSNDDVNAARDHRFLVFAKDSNNWEQIDVRQYDYDVFGEQNDYDVSLESQGSWPQHVVAAMGWLEGAAETHVATPLSVSLSHPQPFVIETTDGSLYTWQFQSGPSGESFLIPLGQVWPGSVLEWAAVAQGAGKYTAYGLWGFGADGNLTAIWDGDPMAVNSSGLAIQRYTVAMQSSSFAVATPEGNYPDVAHLSINDKFCYVSDI